MVGLIPTHFQCQYRILYLWAGCWSPASVRFSGSLSALQRQPGSSGFWPMLYFSHCLYKDFIVSKPIRFSLLLDLITYSRPHCFTLDLHFTWFNPQIHISWMEEPKTEERCVTKNNITRSRKELWSRGDDSVIESVFCVSGRLQFALEHSPPASAYSGTSANHHTNTCEQIKCIFSFYKRNKLSLC